MKEKITARWMIELGTDVAKQIDLDGDGGAAGGEEKVHGTLAKWRDALEVIVCASPKAHKNGHGSIKDSRQIPRIRA
jgi:hypothetical protein